MQQIIAANRQDGYLQLIVNRSEFREDFQSTVACDFIKSSISLVFEIPIRELNARTRLSAKVAFARQLAMYIAHVRLGLKLGVVGGQFGRDRTTVAHACRVIEDRRDEPEVDFLADCMERSVDEWLRLVSANADSMAAVSATSARHAPSIADHPSLEV